MAYEFKLPDLGEGLTEGEIARWLVEEGQVIAEDDPLVEVQTDKTTVEIPSPAAGQVARILVQEGDVVPVGTVIVVIGETARRRRGAAARPKRSEPATAQRRRQPPPAAGVQATPLMRRMAEELGVDLLPSTAPGPRAASPKTTSDEPAGDCRAAEGGASRSRRPPTHRRAHGRAHREVPPVTWVEECDFSKVDLGRLVASVLKAVAEA